MTTKLNRIERAVLLGAEADRRKWAAAEYEYEFRLDRFDRADWNGRIKDARENVVELNLDGWLGGGPSPSDRTQASRAYKRLEEAGLLVGLRNWGRYITHLALTPAGMALAAELLQEGGTDATQTT